MKKRARLARWSALGVVLVVMFALGFSAFTLAGGAKKGAMQIGDCCLKPADGDCSSCYGVWLCGNPERPGTCSCVCTPAAADYGCGWTYPVCR